MFCIAFVYCTVTNLALWLQQTNKVYLLTKATEFGVGQRCCVFSAKMWLGIKMLCVCVVCRKKVAMSPSSKDIVRTHRHTQTGPTA